MSAAGRTSCARRTGSATPSWRSPRCARFAPARPRPRITVVGRWALRARAGRAWPTPLLRLPGTACARAGSPARSARGPAGPRHHPARTLSSPRARPAAGGAPAACRLRHRRARRASHRSRAAARAAPASGRRVSRCSSRRWASPAPRSRAAACALVEPRALQAEADALLGEAQGPRSGRPRIGLHLGAACGPAKRWAAAAGPRWRDRLSRGRHWRPCSSAVPGDRERRRGRRPAAGAAPRRPSSAVTGPRSCRASPGTAWRAS